MNPLDYEQLTLFPEDSLDHASRLVLPGSAEARQMTVTSGLKCLELYKKSGPLGLLGRMLLASSTWRSTRCFLTWKISATPSKRLLFRLAASTPRTKENVVLLWRTPKATDAEGRGTYATYEAYQKRIKSGHQISLANKVKFPEMSPKERWIENVTGEDGQPILWKTPIASDGANREFYHNSRGEPNLSGMVKLWPTPTTGAGLCGGTGNFQQLKALKEQGVITEEERRNMSQGNGGQLNPNWVCRMMGFPDGWLNVDEDGQTEVGKVESLE